MLAHHLKAAWRQLWLNRAATLLNLLGLVIGLGSFVFAEGAASWLSGRGAAASYARIYLITERTTHPTVPANSFTSMLLAPALQAALPAGFKVARLLNREPDAVRAGATKLFLQTCFVEPALLAMFPLPSAGAAALAAPHSVVLSRRAAWQLFGSRPALGQTVTIAGIDATVTGVSALPGAASPYQLPGSRTDVIASWDLYQQRHPELTQPGHDDQWFAMLGTTYVAVPAAVHDPVGALNARLAGFGDRHIPKTQSQAFFAAIPGYELLDNEANLGVRSDVTGLTAASILELLATVILATAAANYLNLATAQVLARGREVRIRRIIGASTADLRRQHLIETALMIGLACLLIAAAATLLLPLAQGAIGEALPLILVDRVFWLHVGLAVAVLLVAAGLYPALLFASQPTVAALPARRWGRWLRFALTCVQFASAAMLLIFALVARSENRTLQQAGAPPGADPVVAIQSDPGAALGSLRAALRTIPEQRGVSATRDTPWSSDVTWDDLTRDRPGAPPVTAIFNAVGEDYLTTMGIRLLAGRALSPLHAGDQPPPEGSATTTQNISVMIDRDLARQLGFRDPAAAVGGRLIVADTGPLRVVGVTEDHPTNIMVMGIHGNVYWSATQTARVTLVRLDPARLASGLAHIDAVWNQTAPLAPIKRDLVSDVFSRGYAILAGVIRSITLLVVPAILVALAGLLGMAIEMARTAQREVAIRKMVGASTADAGLLLLWRFARPVLIANLIAWPAALVLCEGYVSLFTTRAPLTAWPFLGGMAATLGIAGLTVARLTWRTARSSPADVLRAE